MRMRVRVRVAGAAAVVGGLMGLGTVGLGTVGVLGAPPAAALSCAQLVAEDGDRVFLGRVVARKGDEQITVRVVENRGTVPLPEQLVLTLEMWGWDAPRDWPRVSDETWAFVLQDGKDVSTRCNTVKAGELDAARASGPPSPAVPNEAWNAETNPDMERLAAQHAAASGRETESRSAGELAGWAGGGLLLGGVSLAATRRHQRR